MVHFIISLAAVFAIFISTAPQVKAADLAPPVQAGVLNLQQLIEECLKNSPELKTSGSQVSAAEYRVPQAKTLPDPMLTIGYQNEGFNKFTYGNSNNPNTQGIVSASQSFPFPGKLGLRGEAASKEAESLGANYEAIRLKAVSRVKELYFDLYATYKYIDLIHESTSLFGRAEDAALARYSAGKGSQQEVLMSQTEKYLLLEKEELLRLKIESLDAMLNAAVGRPAGAAVGRPSGQPPARLTYTLDDIINIANEQSPELKAKDKMIEAAESRVAFSKKDYYPDFTVTASFFPRGNGFEDMWSLTAGVTLPIFYRTKQRQAVNEAESSLNAARSDKEATRLMIASTIRDNYATLKAAEKLMSLYKDGLIPKSRQDVDLALSGYETGTVDAITVMTRIKAIIDFEMSYWGQFAEREKAIARLEAAANLASTAYKQKAGDQ
jgi:cobalt-zinc-cadmium efflux system outer membrane protein